MFFSHTEFMCFVSNWEQAANYSLLNFNWLVYITDISLSKAQWSLYVRPDFNSTFLRSAKQLNLLFLCGNEKKNISLYNNNWLDYITVISTPISQWSLYVTPDYHSTFLSSAHTQKFFYLRANMFSSSK